MRDEWKRSATNLLKAELTLANVSYEELSTRLTAMGLDESYKGLANKINRGAFTLAFFLQCMCALGKESVRLELIERTEWNH